MYLGLAFGLSQSPGKFQSLNRVAVNALNLNGVITMLYLDDRLQIFNFPDVKIEKDHTFLGSALLVLLLVAFGGFLYYKKCQFEPVRRIEYLGFILDSEKETIAVPKSKYDKTMALISSFLAERKLEVKMLETIRGKLCSWMVVIPIMQLFIRQQNAIIQKADTEKRAQLSWSEIDKEALLEELAVWQELKLVQLERKWRDEQHSVFTIRTPANLALYTDSSQYSMGGKLFRSEQQTKTPICQNHFQWSNDNGDQPIHVKEVNSSHD